MSTPELQKDEPDNSEQRREDRRPRLTDNRVPIVALAAILLANLLIELLGAALSGSSVGAILQRPLVVVAYVLAPLALLVWLVGHGIQLWRQLKRRLRRWSEVESQSQGTAARPRSPALKAAAQAPEQAARLAGTFAKAAADWFREEEPTLRRHIAEHARDKDPPSGQVVEELAAVADALETWYLQGQRLDDFTKVNDHLRQIATRSDRPDLRRLAALRAAKAHRLRGHLSDARTELDAAKEIAERTPRHPRAALEARQRHEWALIHLAEATRHRDDDKAAAEELEDAARELEAGWAHLPRADISGQITTLVNLAVTALRRERLGPMARRHALGNAPGEPDLQPQSRVSDLFRTAEASAKVERDRSGLAHISELRGVAAWLDDRHKLAVEQWGDACHRYAKLGLVGGVARCAQHLGSAIAVVPEVAGFLPHGVWKPLDAMWAPLDAMWKPFDVEHATDEEKARRLLDGSKALRAMLPYVDTEIADDYLAVLQDHRRRPPLRLGTDSLRERLRRFGMKVRQRWKGR